MADMELFYDDLIIINLYVPNLYGLHTKARSTMYIT